MKREHLINSILSAVFPSGSIPLTVAYKVPRILGLVDELADEVWADDGPPAPPEPPPVEAAAPEPASPGKPKVPASAWTGPKGVNWDAEPRLGKVPDSVLATQYGVVAQTVFNARKKRGIPAWTPNVPSLAEAQNVEPATSTVLPAPAVVSISERTAAPPPVDRQRELDIIEEHIKTKGVTKVKSRYVEPDSIPANPKGRGGLV